MDTFVETIYCISLVQMSYALRFAIGPVAALALLTWGALVIVHRTTNAVAEAKL